MAMPTDLAVAMPPNARETTMYPSLSGFDYLGSSWDRSIPSFMSRVTAGVEKISAGVGASLSSKLFGALPFFNVGNNSTYNNFTPHKQYPEYRGQNLDAMNLARDHTQTGIGDDPFA